MKSVAIPSLSESLERYLADIRQYPVLTMEEERELARTCRAALVTANLRFVVKIAYQYRSYGFRLADLIQEGNLGLMAAVQSFDPDRGIRLVSYAAWWIRSRILLHIKATAEKGLRWTSIPSSTSEDDADEVTVRHSGWDLSSDASERDGDRRAMESLAGEAPSQDHALANAQEELSLRGRIGEALAHLDRRERFVIEQRFMSDDSASLKDIGVQLGIGYERARQLESRAKSKIKLYLAPFASEIDWPMAADGGAA
ncbi:MAG: sigma-70 family RNA polymerase sigma factor [Myxococcales bacterium]